MLFLKGMKGYEPRVEHFGGNCNLYTNRVRNVTLHGKKIVLVGQQN